MEHEHEDDEINLPLQFTSLSMGSISDSKAIMELEHKHEIDLPELPESCISTILSFTTPRDICRFAAVSKVFRSAAYDDFLWSKFIPQKCYQILPRAVTPPEFCSKRKLYNLLCDSILIDGGTKRFWLDRSTAKIGYMLSARELYIIWGNDQRYWRWVSQDDSRFEEVLELLEVCWLDLGGEMDCTLLSADAEYRVSFVLKFGEQSYGWDAWPFKFSVTTPGGEHMESEEVLIENHEEMQRMNGDGWMEVVANDGWMEVVAGEFTVTADSSHIRFSMREVESNQWKSGLLIDGVRIEPKST